MPISYQIDLPRELIRTQARGSVTPDEVAEHLRELEADPLFQKPLDVLLDLRACASLPDRNQLARVADQLRRLGGPQRFLRCAIVTGRTAMYGMTRMFEVLAEEQFASTHTFRTRREAELWLIQGRARARGQNEVHATPGRAASAS
jgi:hypothetical protein